MKPGGAVSEHHLHHLRVRTARRERQRYAAIQAEYEQLSARAQSVVQPFLDRLPRYAATLEELAHMQAHSPSTTTHGMDVPLSQMQWSQEQTSHNLKKLEKKKQREARGKTKSIKEIEAASHRFDKAKHQLPAGSESTGSDDATE